MKALNFLISGVGGQGTLLASDVLAEVGAKSGFDVKKAEVHGMAQRGGSVNSHVRWGSLVLSPVVGSGEVDVLISFEKLETLRYLNMLRPGARVIIGEVVIPPLSVSSGNDRYPDDEQIRQAVYQVTQDLHFVPSIYLADELGNARAHNVVILGALSALIPEIPTKLWLDAIKGRVPAKHLELNQRAFQAGWDYIASHGIPKDPA